MSTKTKKPAKPRTPRVPKMSKSAARAEGAAKTDRLRKAALAEINDRLEGGKQDHEVPSEKEVANNAHLGAAAKGKKAKGEKASKTPQAPKPAKEPKPKRVSAAGQGDDRRDGGEGSVDEPRRQDPRGHALRRHHP
ncbi:MAG: hypothetical protein DYG92_12645 [Leptolyngbya sp. PLA1]|nr:hypothetical protein [Leptolyngbya sp. PLA1]